MAVGEEITTILSKPSHPTLALLAFSLQRGAALSGLLLNMECLVLFILPVTLAGAVIGQRLIMAERGYKEMSQ